MKKTDKERLRKILEIWQDLEQQMQRHNITQKGILIYYPSAGLNQSPAGPFLFSLSSSFFVTFVIKLTCLNMINFSKEVTEWNL